VSLQRRAPNIRVQPCLLAIREFYYVVQTREILIVFCGRLNYVWIHQGGKQAALPAPTYIDYVMTSIQNLIDDEKIFPTKSSMCVITTIFDLRAHELILGSSPPPTKKIKPSILHSQQRLGPFIDNFYVFLLISIMHIIHRYYTFDLNLISTHFSHISLHLGENTSCWRCVILKGSLMPLLV
jgi:hypothetical protein